MITLYIKSHCPYCIHLIRLLDDTDIPYQVRDVMQDSTAHDSMMSLSGNAGVPQVHVNNVILYDYDSEETLIQDIRAILEKGNIDQSWLSENTSSIGKILE